MTLPTVLIDSIRATAVSNAKGESATTMCEIDGRWFVACAMRPFVWSDLRPRVIGAWRVLTGKAVAMQFASQMPSGELAAWCEKPALAGMRPGVAV